MLTNPPCIRGLIGCGESSFFDEEGDTGGAGSTGGSGSSGPTGGSASGSGGSGGSSVFDTSGFSSSVSSVSSHIAGDGSNLAARLSSGTQRLAQYTVNAVNRGTQAVKGFVFSHGPLPSGAIFDPSRSSKDCVQVGSEVQCTTDLQPGESKNYEMAYKVNNSVSCAIARALQGVKNMSVGSSQGVVTTVSCSMKTESSRQSVSSSVASSVVLGSASGTLLVGTSGTGSAYTGTGAVFMSGTSASDIANASSSGKTGYKTPYMPRTGAADILFQSAITSGVLTRYTPEAVSDFSGQTFIVSIVFGALLLAVFVRRSIQRA